LLNSFGLILFGLAFGFYGWLSGLEIGIGFLRFLRRSTLTRYGISLFRPLWLVTVLFAVIGLGSFMNFFRHDIRSISHQLRVCLVIGLVSFAFRALLAISLFYNKKPRLGFSPANILYTLTSFITPLALGSGGIYLLTGDNFWSTTSGWFLIIALFLGLMALAGAFVYFIVGLTPHGRTRTLSRVMNSVFCVFVAIFVQHSLTSHYVHILTLSFVIFIVVVSLIILWQIILRLSGQERYMWFYVSLVAITTPLLLVLSNRPYLVYPATLLTAAYSPMGAGLETLYAVFITMAIIVTGYLLIARPSSSAKSRG
jgi:hypothetical protein